MVEIHVDDIHAYDETDVDLSVLNCFGGAVSVRLKHSKKLRIVFGQDKVIFCSS